MWIRKPYPTGIRDHAITVKEIDSAKPTKPARSEWGPAPIVEVPPGHSDQTCDYFQAGRSHDLGYLPARNATCIRMALLFIFQINPTASKLSLMFSKPMTIPDPLFVNGKLFWRFSWPFRAFGVLSSSFRHFFSSHPAPPKLHLLSASCFQTARFQSQRPSSVLVQDVGRTRSVHLE